jgi:hypothetical protein
MISNPGPFMARNLPFGALIYRIHAKEIRMVQVRLHRIYRRFSFLTFMIGAALTLQCCGQGVTRSKTGSLEIFLQLPQGEDPSLFWYGVHSKSLRWIPEKGTSQEERWEIGTKAPWDPSEGDLIEFLGKDESGRLVVTGEAKVGEEKKVTLPLRRVL